MMKSVYERVPKKRHSANDRKKGAGKVEKKQKNNGKSGQKKKESTEINMQIHARSPARFGNKAICVEQHNRTIKSKTITTKYRNKLFSSWRSRYFFLLFCLSSVRVLKNFSLRFSSRCWSFFSFRTRCRLVCRFVRYLFYFLLFYDFYLLPLSFLPCRSLSLLPPCFYYLCAFVYSIVFLPLSKSNRKKLNE